MRKILFGAIILFVYCLCGCSSPQYHEEPNVAQKDTLNSTVALTPTSTPEPTPEPTPTPAPSINDVEIYFDETYIELNSKEEIYTVYFCLNRNGYNGGVDFDFFYNGDDCVEFTTGEWEKVGEDKLRVTFDFRVKKNGTYQLTGKVKETNNSSTIKILANIPTTDKTSYTTDITYEMLARYPNNYMKERIVFNGKVTQIMKADYFGEVAARMSIDNDSYQNLYFVFDEEIIDYNLLVDDEITIYGSFDGLYSYTTVVGSELTVPKMKAYIIELKEKPKEVVPTADDIEIVKEYVMSNSWKTYHFMVIRNNGEATVKVSTSTTAYSDKDEILALEEAYVYALGSGCETIIYEAFDYNDKINYFETEFSVSKEKYYESVIQNLSHEETIIENGVIVTVKNNGVIPAEFVQGYALFFKDGEVINYKSSYFTDDDSEIKVGESIKKQLKTYDEFDEVKFYLQGRYSE